MDPATQPDQLRRRIGHVFGGDRGFYDRLSALDNLRYFGDLYGVPVREKKRRIGELLALVGLEGREKARVETYSRGMRQRLHIARCLLHDPDVLFLDEPTIGLDPVGSREVRETVAGLRQSGKTILLTTHHMYEADELCSHVAVIAGGKIVAAGTPAALKSGVADRTIIEIETFGVDAAIVERLRDFPEVASVSTETRGQSEVVVVQSRVGAEIVQRLMRELDSTSLGRVVTREPTLEDAYIELVQSL